MIIKVKTLTGKTIDVDIDTKKRDVTPTPISSEVSLLSPTPILSAGSSLSPSSTSQSTPIDGSSPYSPCTVLDVKKEIEAKTGLPTHQQRLIYGGKQMAEENPLEVYNVSAGSVIHMVLALRGGCGSN